MASIKAKKGNPFEYDTAYSLQEAGFTVNRIDDNTKGIDLIASRLSDDPYYEYYIECKFHKGFSWNKIIKIFEKTKTTVLDLGLFEQGVEAIPLFIFKANQQPVLVAFEWDDKLRIEEFKTFFKHPWSKRPKGYKIWEKK